MSDLTQARTILRDKFIDFTQGWLSEREFKEAVSEYSKTLRESRIDQVRASAPQR